MTVLLDLVEELALEISEDECRCEATHHLGEVYGPCSIRAVALFTSKCHAAQKLICQTALDLLRRGIRERRECTCGHLVAYCWSAVVLP